MTLVEWLTAILDEDERVAQQIPDGEEFPINGLWVVDDYDITQNYLLVTSKRAVLADIAAKRAIIDRHVRDDSWEYGQPCETLRLLASAYAHRDGFDPSWV